jgi:DNA-binding response OmpR family regulator
MPASPAIVVAVINSAEDLVDLLREAFETEGFVVVTALTPHLRDGKTDFESFIRQHRPDVIVYDIAIPYERNWRLFQHFRSHPLCTNVPFVLTSTNVTQVQTIAGSEQEIHEIIGKPYDLDVISRAVRNAAQERTMARRDDPR